MIDPTPHVFITQGDITHLVCDAWLLPTDARVDIRPSWLEAVPELIEARRRLSDEEHDRLRRNQAVPVLRDKGGPMPVLTPVPLHGITSPDEYAPAIASFVTSALEALGTSRTRKSPLRLLAMPAFGTGAGGAAHIPGPTLQALLDVASREAHANRVDIVIVLREAEADFTQSRRREDPARWWPSLSPEQRDRAKELGARAGAGRLVPFLGAGVSASAGAPTWESLMERLAERAGLGPSDYGHGQFSLLDQAEVIRARFEDGHSFRQAIAEEVTLERYGLLPAMVASLGVKQAITLNYDGLMEAASTDIGNTLTVLPWHEVRKNSPWLLKLHGTVEHPDSIVLTRDDYLGYSADRGALSAIVKALLFTHELLFLGFGLTDDHFHSIAYEVRKALPSGPHPFGTAVIPMPSQWLDAVWKDRVEILPMAQGSDVDFESATRMIEIFMDCLLCHASTSQSFLLRDGYEAVLNDGERALRDRVIDFVSDVTPKEMATPAWSTIQEVLESFGYRKTSHLERPQDGGAP